MTLRVARSDDSWFSRAQEIACSMAACLQGVFCFALSMYFARSLFFAMTGS
jgi:hypothetical protein